MSKDNILLFFSLFLIGSFYHVLFWSSYPIHHSLSSHLFMLCWLERCYPLYFFWSSSRLTLFIIFSFIPPFSTLPELARPLALSLQTPHHYCSISFYSHRVHSIQYYVSPTTKRTVCTSLAPDIVLVDASSLLQYAAIAPTHHYLIYSTRQEVRKISTNCVGGKFNCLEFSPLYNETKRKISIFLECQ